MEEAIRASSEDHFRVSPQQEKEHDKLARKIEEEFHSGEEREREREINRTV